MLKISKCSTSEHRYFYPHIFKVWKPSFRERVKPLKFPEGIVTSIPKNISYLRGCIRYCINLLVHTQFSASQLQCKLCLFDKLKFGKKDTFKVLTFEGKPWVCTELLHKVWEAEICYKEEYKYSVLLEDFSLGCFQRDNDLCKISVTILLIIEVSEKYIKSLLLIKYGIKLFLSFMKQVSSLQMKLQ